MKPSARKGRRLFCAKSRANVGMGIKGISPDGGELTGKLHCARIRWREAGRLGNGLARDAPAT
jgi:hypothetical protein